MQMAIDTDKAPAAVGPYSQARWAGDMLFISGQLALAPGKDDLQGETAAEQAEQVMKNLGAILQAAGMGPENLVKCNIFLLDMAEFQAVNQVYGNFFQGCPMLPARACVAVAGLPKGGLVEIEAIAYKG